MSDSFPSAPSEGAGAQSTDVVVSGRSDSFLQSVAVRSHRFQSDEPAGSGGGDAGPGPYDLLLAALGSCTSMTLSMYARRKAWPLERVTVRLRHGRIHADDCASCDTKEGMLDHIDREILLEGDLLPEQIARLGEMADRCPVHRTLTSEIHITTRVSPRG